MVRTTENMEELDRLHSEVTKFMATPKQQRIGVVLHADPIRYLLGRTRQIRSTGPSSSSTRTPSTWINSRAIESMSVRLPCRLFLQFQFEADS
jgi:hypothetical protein